MAKIPVQIVADPAAATWLMLSSETNSSGASEASVSLSLERDTPIDVQLSRFVADRMNLRNSFGVNSNGNQSSAPTLPAPSTLGLLVFSRSPSSSELLRKLRLKTPVPKPRSLTLDSLLLYSDTLLPGVDSSASTSSNTADLFAFVNASGGEASPWQLVHTGCTPAELAAVAGHATVANGSFGSNPLGAATKQEQQQPAATGAEQPKDAEDAADKKAMTPEEAEAAAAEKEKKEQEEKQKQEAATAAEASSNPPPSPGRMTLVLVGDLLTYCHKDIFSMVASMARPMRTFAPKVVDTSLLAYTAQDAVIVATGLRVSRDGCSVWRPRTQAAAARRHASVIHSCSNLAIEATLPVPSYENGCCVFVNHAIGPAAMSGGRGASGDFGVRSDSAISANNNNNGNNNANGCSVFRRVLRITWSDAFMGAEHGGPEARKRFSAPCVAVGLLHSSQALQALRQAEQSHVFGKIKESVMWCMSPDAALFPGPHLHPVRGPSFQAQPHLYVPNPLLQIRSPSGSNASPSAASANSSPSRSQSEFATALTNNRLATHGKAAEINPSVISTTVTIVCDPSMHAVTFLNNGRRVATWDLSEIWATRQHQQQQQNHDQQQYHQQQQHEDEFASVFYPVVDIGSSGTVVEIVC